MTCQRRMTIIIHHSFRVSVSKFGWTRVIAHSLTLSHKPCIQKVSSDGGIPLAASGVVSTEVRSLVLPRDKAHRNVPDSLETKVDPQASPITTKCVETVFILSGQGIYTWDYLVVRTMSECGTECTVVSVIIVLLVTVTNRHQKVSFSTETQQHMFLCFVLGFSANAKLLRTAPDDS